MMRARFSEDHILGILRAAEAEGASTICQRENITPHTLERWKGVYRDKLIDSAPGGRPSRSQRTRDANAINQLGVRLVALSPNELDQLEIPLPLREAIDVCKQLRKSGRGRQQRLVGKLLRAEDSEALRARIKGL